MAELLAATIGEGEAETTDQSALFGAWRTAIELAAARNPLVLVFEDLHWSSDSLLDLVEYIIQPRGDLPLVMIVLTRPELLDRRPAWGGGRRNHLSLELDPLDDSAVATLVGNLLEAAPADLVDAVVQRAEGNPFYAGEIVRAIAERLDPSSIDSTEVGRLLATLPDTVQATILARLDQLPASSRRVLQVGAIFGRAFRPSGVAAIEPDLTDGLDAAIEQLVERDLIRPSGADGYSFRHILIRDVAYQTLPRAERSRMHAAAGEWLEAHSADRGEAFAELIAFHYREGASLSRVLGEPPEEELRERAEHWLGRAADAAIAAGASLEANQHLRAALEVTPEARLPDVWVRIAQTALDGGTAIDASNMALELSTGQDRSPAWRLSTIAGLLLWQTRFVGSVEDAKQLSVERVDGLRQEARALLELTDDRRSRARFLAAEGFVPFWRGSRALSPAPAEAALAEASVREGLALAEEIDDPLLASAALDALSSLRQDEGDFASARSLAERRLTFADRLDLFEVIDAQAMLAWCSCVLGDLAQADATSGAAMASLQPGQVPTLALHLSSWRMYALVATGRWVEALAAAERARGVWIDINRVPAGYARLGFTAAFMVARNRRDERSLELISDVLDAMVERYNLNPRHRLVKQIRTGDLEVDIDLLVDAARVMPSLTELWLVAACDRGVPIPAAATDRLLEGAERHAMRPLMAVILRARGLNEARPEAFRRALSISEEIGAVPALARVACELGQLTDDQALLQRGIGLLRGIGDLEMLDHYEGAGEFKGTRS